MDINKWKLINTGGTGIMESFSNSFDTSSFIIFIYTSIRMVTDRDLSFTSITIRQLRHSFPSKNL